MRVKITQYGLSKASGGWDEYGDSGTDQWLGNRGNILNTSSCALTASAATALKAQHGCLLKIIFDQKHVYYRTYDDTAPEDDPRLDMFFPWAFDKTIPADFAEVQLA